MDRMKQHDKDQKYIEGMLDKEETDFRKDVASQRNAVITAQWADFNYNIRKFRVMQHGRIMSDPYSFWMVDEFSRLICMAVVRHHFRGEKLVVTRVAKELGFDRNKVGKLLKEARESGLLVTVNGCQYKPSFDTIDGFTYYTSESMKMTSLAALATSILSLKYGSFQKNIPCPINEKRVSIGGWDD